MSITIKTQQVFSTKEESDSAEFLQQAMQHIHQGHKMEALELLNAELKKNEQNAKLHELAGLLHLEYGDGYKGLDHLDKAIALASPADESLLTNYAHALAKTGKLQQAMNFYQEALRYNPKYAEAYSGCANIYLAQEDWEQAYSFYDKSIVLEPKNPNYYNNKGLVALKLGMHEDALINLQQACTLADDVILYKTNLASAYIANGETNKADDILLNIDEANHDDHYFTTLGKFHAATGLLSNAIEYFTMALNLNAYNLDAYEQCAVACYGSGDQNGAQYCIKQCLEMKPESLRYRYLDCLYAITQRVNSRESAAKLQGKFIYKVNKFISRLNKKSQSMTALTNVGFVSPLYFLYSGDASALAIKKYYELQRILLQMQDFPRAVERSNVVCIVTSNLDNMEMRALCFDALVHYFSEKDGWMLHILSLNASVSDDFGLMKIHYLNTIDETVRKVYGLSPDIIIYTDLGSHWIPSMMAELRLAPYQLQTWNAGSACVAAEIDGMLAPQFLDSANFSDITKGELIFYEQPLTWGDSQFEEKFDMKENFIICAANSLKYQGEYVDVIINLLCKNKLLKVIFSSDYGWNSENLRAEMISRGLERDIDIEQRIFFRKGNFTTLLAQARCGKALVLDSFPYSDFLSAKMAIEAQVPVVCLSGPELHGQLAAQLVMACGLGSMLVVDNIRSYNELANHLLRDDDFYTSIRSRLELGKEELKKNRNQAEDMLGFFLEGL